MVLNVENVDGVVPEALGLSAVEQESLAVSIIRAGIRNTS